MDDAVQRFKRQADRELGDRQGAERRYSDGLRQQAVVYRRTREAEGDGVRAVATALGIAPVSLRRWARNSTIPSMERNRGRRRASPHISW